MSLDRQIPSWTLSRRISIGCTVCPTVSMFKLTRTFLPIVQVALFYASSPHISTFWHRSLFAQVREWTAAVRHLPPGIGFPILPPFRAGPTYCEVGGTWLWSGSHLAHAECASIAYLGKQDSTSLWILRFSSYIYHDAIFVYVQIKNIYTPPSKKKRKKKKVQKNKWYICP